MSTEPSDEYSLRALRDGDEVGQLSFDPRSDTFRFEYAAPWRRRSDAFQLSPHIPYDHAATAVSVRRFIQNLLPEGQALDVAAAFANVSKSNTFALVRALGRESAGALRFLPPGEQAPSTPQRRRVGFDELQLRIDERDRRPFAVWDGKIRISVAGFQDKLLVMREGDELYLVDGTLSSTHILKPQPRSAHLPYMVANEHFCMRLANRIGMAREHAPWAARVDILRVPDPVLCVERFDRQLRAGRVRSIHIVDGCQALDRPVDHKYERNFGGGADVAHIRDGVGFQALGTLRASGFLANPAVDVRQIARWGILTLLLGNSDAHAKNLSFFAQGRLLSVAPFYDLVCTAVYDGQRIEHDLAMAFGDEFQLADIKAFALADFCERLAWPRSAFARELKALCQIARREAAAQAQDPLYTDDERATVEAVADFVTRQAALLEAAAKDIPRFAADNFGGALEVGTE